MKRNIEVVERSRVTAHGGRGLVAVSRVFGGEDAPLPRDCGFNFVDVAEVPQGASIGKHTHEDTTEIYLVLEGRGRYLLDGDWVTVQPGDVLVNHCGMHALESTSEEPLRIYVVEASIQGGRS